MPDCPARRPLNAALGARPTVACISCPGRAQQILLHVLATATLLVVLWMPVLATAQTSSEPVQTDSAIQLDGKAAPDSQIRRRIVELLGEIDGFDKVGVSVSNGVVTLAGEVLDNARQTQLTTMIERIDGVVAIENQTLVNGRLDERLDSALSRLKERTRNIIANAPIFFVAMLVFVMISAFGWLVTTRLRIWQRLAPNSFIAEVYSAVARIAFIILGLVVALDILNATALLGAVLGAAGVAGLAVGFAVRDTVENFIASILLSLRQPFRPNDFVEIAGDMGTVARLTSRATILISPEGNHIRIPNATVFKGRIVNYTRDANRRFEFELGVDADADLAAALSTAVDALQSLPFVLRDPSVGAWVKEVGDSNVILTFTGWVDQTRSSFLKARGEAIRTAKTALESNGFGLPEPIYRLRVDANAAASLLPVADQPHSAPAADTGPAATETPLPAASDPARVEDANEEAAMRERNAPDGGGDLLSEGQKAE
ncbi:Small-conductance mechanosensitive channel [Phaeobacter inhibens]|uniref:Small-conductance mechanosensitive channel n=1 Tax=Phaeobacter inhibens TaxID=221822 RepID=A0ABM6RAS4_9RHOB|nr:Small-conductance mechanosensitive channel [Phaeobacter inhibens]AUQ93441.1 Small-conductance mechanosensitive channel [Phaeobacter inhibens]AUR18744.1 Small-conductance mechanosensitive channel [Phaeobacter inhibens]